MAAAIRPPASSPQAREARVRLAFLAYPRCDGLILDSTQASYSWDAIGRARVRDV